MGLPFPTKGPYGTVGINSELWSQDVTDYTREVLDSIFEDQARTFIHELGNILSYRATKTKTTPGSYDKFGDPKGIGSGYKDTDSGAKVELCVFGSVKY